MPVSIHQGFSFSLDGKPLGDLKVTGITPQEGEVRFEFLPVGGRGEVHSTTWERHAFLHAIPVEVSIRELYDQNPEQPAVNLFFTTAEGYDWKKRNY